MSTATLKPPPEPTPPAATTAQPTGRFAFGRNWKRFIRTRLTEERITGAMDSLVAFLGPNDLRGKCFLDLGSGSGLFSLAAHRLGAVRVVSCDVDEDCVECCRELRRREGWPPSWDVVQGSVLDAEFMGSLEAADVVYCWGVLHHTGRMWDAMEQTARLVRPGGVLYLGLYNHLEGARGSSYWLVVKERYNRASRPRRRLMEWAFVLRHTILPNLRRGKNPLPIMNDYHGRGMSYYTDVVDWVGGLPYETSTPEEVLRFYRGRFAFVLENLRTTNGWGVNEYLFRAPTGST